MTAHRLTAIKLLLCRLFGHRWSYQRDACDRCRLTAAALMLRSRPDPTWDEVGDAYWRGVQDGRKVDRRRSYELGYRRGARYVADVAERIFVGETGR